MRSLNRLFLASAALACLGTAQAVAGGPPDPYPNPGFYANIMGGGATFPSIVYRQIMDCAFHPLGYGNNTGPGPLAINTQCPSYPFGEASGFGYLYIYYAPTGSGNGKASIKTNNNNTLTSSITTTIPYTSSVIPNYPWPIPNGYHFSGSDDVWNLADATTWNAPGGPQSKYGNLVQLPGVAGAVTLVMNGNDGPGGTGLPLVQNGTAVSGSVSAINLTRQAMCGIFSGHITKWNNSILTAQNGGVPMGTGQISVVHRFDGSGTSFLLTNGLQLQCRAVTGPNSESDSTVVSYAFPWGDASVCPSLPRGANQVNWPDQFPSICGGTNNNLAPTGSVFLNGGSPGGSQEVVNQVIATPGAIGYASADFSKIAPNNPTGPIVPNLQNEWDVSTNVSGTPAFVAPTVTAIQAALNSATPNFPDSATRGNPLAWSLQGVVPDPVASAAYPLAGFSWLEIYQCYNSNAIDNVPVQLLGFLYTLYGPGAAAILANNGFAQVPEVWLSQIYQVLGDSTIAPSRITDPSCTGKVGAT